LKGHLLKEVKPKTIDELIGGIRTFWKCCSYIDRVIPFVILNGGGPSGFKIDVMNITEMLMIYYYNILINRNLSFVV